MGEGVVTGAVVATKAELQERIHASRHEAMDARKEAHDLQVGVTPNNAACYYF